MIEVGDPAAAALLGLRPDVDLLIAPGDLGELRPYRLLPLSVRPACRLPGLLGACGGDAPAGRHAAVLPGAGDALLRRDSSPHSVSAALARRDAEPAAPLPLGLQSRLPAAVWLPVLLRTSEREL
jgi:hypothetical protein